MSIVKYDEWVINLNEAETRKLYEVIPVHEDEANLRYQIVCEHLLDEEQEFFRRFCIDPKCCDVLFYSEDGVSYFGGRYFVYGDYIHYPEQDVVVIDDASTDITQYNCRDDRVCIGRFKFDFQCEDRPIHITPDNMPEGCISIDFFATFDSKDIPIE